MASEERLPVLTPHLLEAAASPAPDQLVCPLCGNWTCAQTSTDTAPGATTSAGPSSPPLAQRHTERTIPCTGAPDNVTVRCSQAAAAVLLHFMFVPQLLK